MKNCTNFFLLTWNLEIPTNSQFLFSWITAHVVHVFKRNWRCAVPHVRHFIFRRKTSSINWNKLNLMLSIFKRQLVVVHIIFALRSALKGQGGWERPPPRWKQCHRGLIENGGVWTLPVYCRPIQSFEFKWHLIEKVSQIYVLVIFISFSLNVMLFSSHKVNNVAQILISNVKLAEEPKRSSLFKPF